MQVDRQKVSPTDPKMKTPRVAALGVFAFLREPYATVSFIDYIISHISRFVKQIVLSLCHKSADKISELNRIFNAETLDKQSLIVQQLCVVL